MNARCLIRGKYSKSMGFIYWDISGAVFDIRTCKYTGEAVRFSEIIAETVGQCTGLCDKEGVLIFEGDIMRVQHSPSDDVRFGVVKWISEGYQINYEVYTLRDCLIENMVFYGGASISMNQANITVVGNICDNLALLVGDCP